MCYTCKVVVFLIKPIVVVVVCLFVVFLRSRCSGVLDL